MTPAESPSRGAPAAFVVVDWGTSSFRGWLMSADGEVLAESRGGEGSVGVVSSNTTVEDESRSMVAMQVADDEQPFFEPARKTLPPATR